MQKFAYTALTQDGVSKKGTVIAQTEEEVKQFVTKGGMYLVSAVKLKDEMGNQKPVPTKDLVNFCRQLGSILKAGLPLSSALEMLHERLDSPKLKKMLGALYEMVQKGNSLSDAIDRQGRAFPPLMKNMVRAGEMSGDLDKTLVKLADHFENENKRNNEIKSAMRYPMILGIVTVLVVVVLVVFVLPSMTASLSEEQMPATTKILMGLSDFIIEKYPILIMIIILLYAVVPVIFRIPKVRYTLDKLKLNMPKVGKLMRMIYTARFAKNLATLYEGGIELIEAMGMCTAIVGNTYITKMMDEAVFRVKKGESISKAISVVTAFDPLLVSMMFVGEESGDLGEILGQVASYFEEESGAATKGLTDLIQPAMLMIMAGVVGFIIISVMSPMMASYDSMGDMKIGLLNTINLLR